MVVALVYCQRCALAPGRYIVVVPADTFYHWLAASLFGVGGRQKGGRKDMGGSGDSGRPCHGIL